MKKNICMTINDDCIYYLIGNIYLPSKSFIGMYVKFQASCKLKAFFIDQIKFIGWIGWEKSTIKMQRTARKSIKKKWAKKQCFQELLKINGLSIFNFSSEQLHLENRMSCFITSLEDIQRYQVLWFHFQPNSYYF